MQKAYSLPFHYSDNTGIAAEQTLASLCRQVTLTTHAAWGNDGGEASVWRTMMISLGQSRLNICVVADIQFTVINTSYFLIMNLCSEISVTDVYTVANSLTSEFAHMDILIFLRVMLQQLRITALLYFYGANMSATKNVIKITNKH